MKVWFLTPPGALPYGRGAPPLPCAERSAAEAKQRRPGEGGIRFPAASIPLTPPGRGDANPICASLTPPPREGGRLAQKFAACYGRLLLGSIVVMLSSSLCTAADVAAGRRKALACQTCHGLDGLAKIPDAPHIAGQPEPYFIKAMNDYRKGVRQHEMMTIVVKD